MRFFNGGIGLHITLTLLLLGVLTVGCTFALADANPGKPGAQLIDMETGTCFSGTPQGVRVERYGTIDKIICQDGAIFQFDHSQKTITFKCIKPELAMKR